MQRLKVRFAHFGLSHWPFALKMAFCPAIAMIVILGLGLHGILAADTQAALVRAVVHHDLAVAMRLSQQANRLQEINSGLYRLTTLQAIKTPDVDLALEIESLVTSTGLLADSVAADAADLQQAPGQDEIMRAAAGIRLYRDAIDVFGSMLEIDFSSAVEFFRPFDTNAKQILGLIDAIAARTISNASSRAEQSARIAERIRIALIIVSGAGSMILFGAAATLSRATVGSVKRIAAAAEKVALGSAELNVGALARGDELGTIVRSLAVFQANVSQIAFLAHHDALTRLPNRVLFQDRIEQALARLDRDVGFAVLCLDLDRFKIVNDTLGHPVGDELLRQVADRLVACVREGDSVARLGGDEFAVILADTIDLAGVARRAAKIIEVLSTDYDIDGQQINIGTSIGMALAPVDGATASQLLKNADTALYGAKANGRGTSCFYEASMNIALQRRRETEVGLRQAIALDEFRLYYQPLVTAGSRRVSGFEALVRWQHPTRGFISADEFIPVAESSGLIGAIGHWVLRHACAEAAAWPDNISLAVNLSPSQFKDKDLVANVRDALAASGLPACRLELEITESVLLIDSTSILDILGRIKEQGVRIAMDDFGTGYSSLSYLRSFPFDKVKIDQTFVRDLPSDGNAIAIVRAIVGLSGTFGMSVTAEGVETEAQADLLEHENCDHLQGYLFSRPIPGVHVPALIERMGKSVRAAPTQLAARARA